MSVTTKGWKTNHPTDLRIPCADYHMCNNSSNICIACRDGKNLEDAIKYFEDLKLFDRTAFVVKQKTGTK
jgi:hypothetical protein